MLAQAALKVVYWVVRHNHQVIVLVSLDEGLGREPKYQLVCYPFLF